MYCPLPPTNIDGLDDPPESAALLKKVIVSPSAKFAIVETPTLTDSKSAAALSVISCCAIAEPFLYIADLAVLPSSPMPSKSI